MKKVLTFLLVLALCLSAAACGKTEPPETIPTTQPEPQSVFTAFLQDLSASEVATFYPRLCVREDGSAFLMTDIINNSQSTLMAADVYFAAFDQLGNPISLVNSASAEYVKAAKLPDLFLAPGETWQANMGLRLTEGYQQIAFVVAIVDTYTDLEQNTVSNPLVDTWMEIYNGNPLEEYILVQLQADDPRGHYEAFLAQVQQEGVVAVDPRTVHDDKTTSLVADLRNDTQTTLTGATLLFAAFDAQGNPVQLTTNTTEDTFVKRLALTDLSIAPGELWQADLGLRLSDLADQIVYVYVLAETWQTEDATCKNTATDRWLEYFSQSPLASYITQP